jgi:DNA-binding transcriptional MerR regulator
LPPAQAAESGPPRRYPEESSEDSGFDVDSEYCQCYTYYVISLLEQYRQTRLPLQELVRLAGRALRSLGAEPADGRVSPELDARTVRYYQTLGLLDKPDRFEGRLAIYSLRHLLQLLCVKKLQAEGYPLALIQESLAGRSTSQLEAVLRERCALPAPPPPPGRSELIATEAVPGVTVVIDPARIADPQEVLDRIRAVLGSRTEERT